MTLTDRDRRILLFLLPVLVLVGYWFLLLSPKRDDLQTAKDERVQAEERRDTAVNRVAILERARQTFASDYAAVVRLGKAIPTSIDSPSLLVQLDQAATGTDTDLSSFQLGERQSGIALPSAAPETPQNQGSEAAQPEGNAAAGGVAAATGPGAAVEAAGEGAEATEAAQNAQAQPQATPPEAAQSQATPAALDSVALTFVFTGTYFDLADFMHRVKRFVFVSGERIFIRGRLLTIDSLTFATGAEGGTATTTTGELTANVTATVYLTPRSQGATAGATPAGPAGTETPAATPAPNETARKRAPATATVRSVR